MMGFIKRICEPWSMLIFDISIWRYDGGFTGIRKPFLSEVQIFKAR